MGANQTIVVFDSSVDRGGGADWYRLHAERENVCDALLKEFRPSVDKPGALGLSPEETRRAQTWHEGLLQARLRKIDDALDRLMGGSYGDCSKCGRWIEDTKLDLDPAVAFCVACWKGMQNIH